MSRLGVLLEDSPKGGFRVHNDSESSLVVEVNSKKHLDPLLIELNKLVLSKCSESLSQGGMVSLGTKVDCVYQMLII